MRRFGGGKQTPPPADPVTAVEQASSGAGQEYRRLIGQTLEFASVTVGRIVAQPERFVALCADQGADPETTLDKLVAETALLALIARRVVDAARVSTLTVQLSRLARTDRHRALIAALPAAAAGLSFLHAALTRLGAPDPSFDRLLAEALANPAAAAIARPVFRCMEQRWISTLLRAGSGSPDCADLVEKSLCFNPGSGFDWDVKTTYAFTHELFYLTDFGRFALPGSLNQASIARAADEALIVQIGLNDLDLLGELLLARSMLNATESAASRFAETLLMETWRDHGFLPGPQFDGDAFDALSSELRPHYSVLAVYHTTFVGALHCALRLTRANGAADKRPEPTNSAAPWLEIDWAANLRRGDAPVLRRVIAAAGDAALPVLAEAALARAIRLNNAPAVRDALLRRAQIGLPPNRLVELATEALTTNIVS